MKILDVGSGNFVAAALSHADEEICVVKRLYCSRMTVFNECMCTLSQCFYNECCLCVFLVAVSEGFWRTAAVVYRWPSPLFSTSSNSG